MIRYFKVNLPNDVEKRYVCCDEFCFLDSVNSNELKFISHTRSGFQYFLFDEMKLVNNFTIDSVTYYKLKDRSKKINKILRYTVMIDGRLCYYSAKSRGDQTLSIKFDNAQEYLDFKPKSWFLEELKSDPDVLNMSDSVEVKHNQDWIK